MESRIFITSDLHFGHNKDFIYEPRGFKSIEEHDETLIKNYNDIVNRNDIVYILGDVMLNNDSAGIAKLRRLNGVKHLVIGNHDTDTRINLYKSLWDVESVEYGYRFKYKKFNFFLSHYPTLTANHDDGKTLSRKTINLCGHYHTKDPFIDWDKGVIYHCELDAHNNCPILIDDIIKEIINKENK